MQTCATCRLNWGCYLYRDLEQVRGEFRLIRSLFEEFKSDNFANDEHFREISMGMSGDYPIAVEEGATIIRVGTSIFGER